MKNAFTEEAKVQGIKLRGCLERYFGGKVEGLAQIKELAESGKNELPRSRAAGYLKGRSITYNPINSTVLALVRFDRVSYTLFLDLVLLRILISLLHFHAPLP